MGKFGIFKQIHTPDALEPVLKPNTWLLDSVCFEDLNSETTEFKYLELLKDFNLKQDVQKELEYTNIDVETCSEMVLNEIKELESKWIENANKYRGYRR